MVSLCCHVKNAQLNLWWQTSHKLFWHLLWEPSSSWFWLYSEVYTLLLPVSLPFPRNKPFIPRLLYRWEDQTRIEALNQNPHWLPDSVGLINPFGLFKHLACDEKLNETFLTPTMRAVLQLLILILTLRLFQNVWTHICNLILWMKTLFFFFSFPLASIWPLVVVWKVNLHSARWSVCLGSQWWSTDFFWHLVWELFAPDSSF